MHLFVSSLKRCFLKKVGNWFLLNNTSNILFVVNVRKMSRSCREIQIPTEYGHMSAKDWGPADGELVLAFHGWQDNAGTFDKLIPCLSPLYRFVAVDLPGHGLSSHKPPGANYHYMEFLLDVRIVADFFMKRPFILLGHSMGGGISMMYASAFPEDVKAVVSLDMLKPVTVSKNEIPRRTAASIRQRVQMIEKLRQAPPVYGRDDALQRLHKAMMGSVTIESAKVLFHRAVEEVDGGVVFTRDTRLQVESIQKMDDDTVKAFLSQLKCQLLIVRSKTGIISSNSSIIDEYKEMFSKNCERFLFLDVEGTHHVHLNEPNTVGRLINSFLEGAEFKSHY